MRLAAAVLVAVFGWLLLLAGRGRSAKKAPDHPPKKHAVDVGAGDHRDQPPAPEDAFAAPPSTAIGHQRPSDGHQYRTQRRKWSRREIFSAISAAAALAGSVFAAVALVIALQAVGEARRKADAAQQALIAADRPWIKVDGLSDARLEVKDYRITLSTKINVTNIGRSPAPYAFVTTRVVADRSINERAAAAARLCREAVEGSLLPFYEIIVPNESHSFFDVAIIGMRDIQKVSANIIERNFEGNVLFFGEERAREFRAHAESLNLIADIAIIGCVTYTIPNGYVAGQTAFIYGINHICHLPTGGLCAFDMTKPAVFEGDELVVREPVGGAFAR